MQNHEVLLEHRKRRFAFPFPLRTIGYCQNLLMPPHTFTDKFEITLRLASAEPYSEDIIEGTVYRCTFPSVIFKVPGLRHQYEVAKPRDSFYFSYDASLYEKMKASGFLADCPIWEIDLTPRIRSAILDAKSLMNSSEEFTIADRLDLLAFGLLEELLLSQGKGRTQDDYIQPRIHKVASHLALNLHRKLDLDKIIADNGFSRRSFFRHWDRYYDLPPRKYIQELKLQEACRLLVQSDAKIMEICRRLHYNDTAYLCGIFRQRFGCTPLQYRKQFTARKPHSPRDQQG